MVKGSLFVMIGLLQERQTKGNNKTELPIRIGFFWSFSTEKGLVKTAIDTYQEYQKLLNKTLDST